MIISSLYQTTISTSSTNMNNGSTITVKATLKDFNNKAVVGKSATITCDVGKLGNGKKIFTANTNNNGEISTTFTCSEFGLATLSCNNVSTQVFIRPPIDFSYTNHTHTQSQVTDFNHTHTKSQITDFTHNHGWTIVKEKETSTYHLTLYANEQIRLCSLRFSYVVSSNFLPVNEFYGNDSDEWTGFKGWIPDPYKPPFQVSGALNYNGRVSLTFEGDIQVRMGENLNASSSNKKTLLATVVWRYNPS